MLEEVGNLWEMPSDARCVTINGDLDRHGQLVMGAGVALEAKTRYPVLPILWGRIISIEFGVFVSFLTDSEDVLIGFPTKRHWKAASVPGLILESAVQLMQQLDRYPQLQRVLLPRPGCGLGGLEWKDVKSLIAPTLDDRVVVVTFK